MPTSPRMHVLVVALLLLAGGLAFGAADTVGNQQGPGINDRLGNLNGLCRLNGGIPGAYSTDTVVTRFYCQGGYLDGLYCDVYADLTYCYWDKVGTGAASGGALQQVSTVNQDLTFVTDLAVDDVTPLTVDMASEPMLVEAVITWNPSADAAVQASMVQVNACRMLGGEELVAHAGGDPDATSFTTQCDGGLLNGMACSLGVGTTTCFFLPGSVPEGNTNAPPMDPVDSAITEEGTVPPTATETEPTATATATAVPTEPLVEPSAEPTSGGSGPWVPPHEIGTLQPLEPLDPTPTPVILT